MTVSPEVESFGSSTKFDDALTKFSNTYADQVETNFAAFQRALRSGRLKTDTDATREDLEFAL